MAMANWRVTVELLRGSRSSRPLLRGQVADDLSRTLADLATVSPGKSGLFVYADTPSVAGKAAEIARKVIAQYELPAEVTISRWHPAKQEWDTDPQFLQRPAEEVCDAENQRRVAAEKRRSERTGIAQWTVRVTLRSRRGAAEVARRLLDADGLPAKQHGKVLIIGASCEPAARDIARRAEQQAPGTRVEVARTSVWIPPIDFGPL